MFAFLIIPLMLAAAAPAPKVESKTEAKRPDAAAVRPAPMSEEQLNRIRVLVREVREQEAKLTGELEKAQRELAGLYNAFELNSADAEKKIAEIAELQRKLLANYHGMQTELRKIVDKDRFTVLKQRLDNAGVGKTK